MNKHSFLLSVPTINSFLHGTYCASVRATIFPLIKTGGAFVVSGSIKSKVDENPEVRATLKDVAGKKLEPYSAAMDFLNSGIDF